MIRIESTKSGRVRICDPDRAEDVHSIRDPQLILAMSPDDADALARALHWAAQQAREGKTRNQTLFIGAA